MRVFLPIVLSALCACSGSHDEPAGQETPSLLPFQTYQATPQPRGGNCQEGIDSGAPLISNGFGFNAANTRQGDSLITSNNVANLQVDFTWSLEGVVEMRGAPALTAQAIFFTAGNTLIAINRISGCEYWRYQTSGPLMRSASVVLGTSSNDEPLVFAADYDGQVHAVSMLDGKVRWTTFAGTEIRHHFVTGGMQLHEDTLLVPISSKEVVLGAFNTGPCCTSHGMLVALDADSGVRKWEYHTTQEASEVIIADQRVGPNGAPIWSTPTIDTVRNRVYIGTGQNYTEPTTDTSDAIIALDLETGEVAWIFQATAGDAWNYACQYMLPLRCPDPEGHDFDFGAPALLSSDGTTLLAGDKGGVIYALAAQSGELLWSRKVSTGSKLGGIHWGMAASNGIVYAAATDFEIDPASGNLEDLVPGANPGIYALRIDSGTLLWEIHPRRVYEGLETPYLFSSALALTNDVLFAGSLDGEVKAFDTADGTELWSYSVDQDLTDINGIEGKGGTIDGAGLAIAGDGIVVNSGYGGLFGGVGRYQAGEGNSLFVFSLPR